MTSKAEDLIASLAEIEATSFESDDSRARAVVAVKSLLDRIKRPIDEIYRITWMEPAYLSALKTCVECNLFTKWVEDGGKSKTVSELAQMSGIKDALLTMNGLEETGQDTYAMTAFTKSLAGRGNAACLTLAYNATYPAALHLPGYLAKTEYMNPIDPKSGNWQDMNGTPDTYIQFIGSDKSRGENFQEVMGAYNAAKPLWVNFYPTDELIKDSKPDVPILVDVGGGKGLEIQEFRDKHPDLPEGSLVLQDLPQVTEQIADPPKGIKMMPHDLFQEQPVKGAKAYFMHIVLHGFSNQDAIKVLKNLAGAMEKGYSRLILHEKVIADQNPTPDVTSMDLTMMSTLSATERSQSTWRKMLTAAGLKITNIYSSPALFEALIEAEVE